MKIFNWVHRKFHHNAIKVDDELQNQVSMEVGLLDAAILTIGTFGLDPFKLPSCHQYPELDYSYSSSGDNESEVNPLVVTMLKDNNATSSPYKKKDDRHTATIATATAATATIAAAIATATATAAAAAAGELIMNVDGVSLMPQIHDHKLMSGRGTTLADLFLADSDHIVQISNLNSVENVVRDKPIQLKAAAQNIDQKLVHRVGQKSHPVKKLNRMMKKMMKRKIHPELCNNMDDKEVDDTAYLLPVPAA